VTEPLEDGVPEGVIRELAGHIDPSMTAHYSHPRLAARRKAVELLVNGGKSAVSGKLLDITSTDEGTNGAGSAEKAVAKTPLIVMDSNTSGMVAEVTAQNHGTNGVSRVIGKSQVIENNGTPGGIRTPDLLLRRRLALSHSIYYPFSSHAFTQFRGFCFRSKLIPFPVK
jgi:hypothetical protein